MKASKAERKPAQQGYYRFPAVRGDLVVFTSEDDIWAVPLAGGVARRLTAGFGRASRPHISPDGTLVAFSGRDEGHTEVYVLSIDGGTPQRLTWTESGCRVIGWHKDGSIMFASAAEQPFLKLVHLWKIAPVLGSEPERIEVGPAVAIDFGESGGVVIGRTENREASAWKRYRGGTAGDIWIDRSGSGDFARFVELDGNVGSPMWIGDRIWFFSDHEGVGNLYSSPVGKGSSQIKASSLKRHTHHEEYYVRHPATDGQTIVYSCGADIWRHDVGSDKSERIAISFASPRMHLARKFVDGADWLEGFDPHPVAHAVAVTLRGRPFVGANFDGPLQQFGDRDGVRYRLARWIDGGKSLVAITDAGGEEQLAVFDAKATEPKRLIKLSGVGTAMEIAAAPNSTIIAIASGRGELVVVDTSSGKLTKIAAGDSGAMAGMNWSPDAAWLAFGFPVARNVTQIRLWEKASGKVHEISEPVAYDERPVFDPEGRWIYFTSRRFFDPVYDKLRFNIGFPRGARPCAISLRKDVLPPFVMSGKTFTAEAKKTESEGKAPKTASKRKAPAPAKPLIIDLEGIKDRISVFPVDDGDYQSIHCTKDRVLFMSWPIEGSLNATWGEADPQAKGSLIAFDIASQKIEPWLDGLSLVKLSADRSHMFCRMRRELRVFKTDSKPDPGKGRSDRERGNVSLNRARISVDPISEWRQMYREAWRLQRDFFWDKGMSKVPWEKIYERYLPLLERVGCRSEFGDLVWEMQGELGTSHAYEMGGDYWHEPRWYVGQLGASLKWNQSAGGWQIKSIVRGDPWQLDATSPLLRPGVDVQPGDVITAIDGAPASREFPPARLLVHRAGVEVAVSLKRPKGAGRVGSDRIVNVRPIWSEIAGRRRDFVEHNRRYVHEKSGGRLGYVHVPNMGPLGYSEFYRYFLREVDREGLVIDVRFNGGGHVSQLLLAQLMQRRLGMSVPRHFAPKPYPSDAPAGPIVALTNEYAGSDGDIFSHAFKMLKLGPLIGKRTWGGVIGIWPRHRLVDGGMTTQPEFSFWFNDVGWKVENYGTDPDIEVEMRPQDYVSGADPQLDRAIAEAMKLVRSHKPMKPDVSRLPDRKAPRLK